MIVRGIPRPPNVPGSINPHYFHIIGDGHQPNSVGVYIPIIRIPIKGGRSPIPKKTRLLTMAQVPPRLSGLGICDLPRVSFLGNDLSRWWEAEGRLSWGVT